MTRRAQIFRWGLLAILTLTLVLGCVQRHRSLRFGDNKEVGQIPLSASWEGTSIKHFDLEGTDAENYFATFLESPADELDQAMLWNLSQSGLFSTISRGQYRTDLLAWGEINRFQFKTEASLISCIPGVGLCTSVFSQVKLSVDIEATVYVALSSGSRKPIASAVVNVARDEWINVAMDKKNVSIKAEEIFSEVGEKLKGKLIARRYAIMEAMGDRPRAPVAARKQAQPRRQAQAQVQAPAPAQSMSAPRQSIFQTTKLGPVAVLDLIDLSETLSGRLITKLTKYLRSRMSSTHRIKVIDRTRQADALKKLVNKERKEFSKACYEKSCQIKLGENLSADHILRAELDQIGSIYTISLEVVNLAQKSTITGATVEFPAPSKKRRRGLADLLTKAIREAVNQL